MRSLLALLLVAAVCAPSPAQIRPPDAANPQTMMPGFWFGPGPLHKVLVYADERDVFSALDAAEAVVDLVDYGAFALVVVDESLFGGREPLRQSGLRFRDELDLLVFNGHRLNGRRPDGALDRVPAVEVYGDPKAPALPTSAGLYVVQFRGPVKEAWIEQLRATGARIVQFVPSNGYVVQAMSPDVPRLADLAKTASVQYVGPFHPTYKMTPEIRSLARSGASRRLSITVQLVDGPGSLQARDQVIGFLRSVDSVSSVGPYINVRGQASGAVLNDIARNPFVMVVELRGVLTRSDERQGQIVAGNVSGSGPTGPGYLSWLASMGFNSSQFSSFSVNVVDDATSLTGHQDLAAGRVAFQLNPTSQTGSQSGHGFLNAHIVAGFNDQTGSAFEDGSGFNYGLGIAPWAQVGSTAIFGNGSSTSTSWEASAYGQGARISTNSWNFLSGIQGNPIPTYTVESQEYDFIVRDASASGGNQGYVLLFSAANEGPGSTTVSTPATAKNVLTVGASENDRQTGTDGCGIGNSGANDINDVISFSSRGPTDDGRWKPEIVAPGTHIQAGVPQSNYGGNGVCNAFFPSGQTLYGWSSGTSHSTPGVAGGAALVRQWFENQALGTPSPAMVKAVLVNSCEYMTGVSANDTLPSNSQGMGLMNLGRAFDAVSRLLVDQTQVLGSTGSSHDVAGQVDNAGKPFRVTLVWTDAPGTSSSSPWVNDLDLAVTVGGMTYRGNVFSGSNSIGGGSHDFRNNTESVFLPAGTGGSFSITVTGASIGGDGVPGNGDTSDQDFALVIYNGTQTITPPSAPSGLVATEVSDTQIDLQWSDGSSNETAFEIERSPDGTSFAALTSVGANVTNYSDAGLTPDTTYFYRLRATNGAGDSAWSNTDSATTLPAGLVEHRATADLPQSGTVSGSFQLTFANDGVTEDLTERQSGGKPANRHSFLVHRWTFSVQPAGSLTFHVNAWHTSNSEDDDFRFEWSTNDQSYSSMLTVTETGDPAGHQTFSLPASLSGTVYVRAVDTDQSQGNRALDTLFVDDMFIRAQGGGGGNPPAAPSGLTAATASSSSISITWNDNSPDEDGFELERSTDGVNFSLRTSTGSNVTSFTDTGLAASTTYSYRVRAFNGFGSSAYSNVDSAPTSGGGGTTDDVSTGETPVDGTITGSYTDTYTNNGVAEIIREERTGGPPSGRVTFLEHVWTFNVTGGSSVALHLNAWRSTSSDNDDFLFEWSTDGTNYTPLITIFNTTDGGTVPVPLPSSTSGAVFIRVTDTDRSPGSNDRDEIFVDHMFIRSQ